MTIAADLPGYADAQRRLRQQFGEPVTFFFLDERTWPSGTPIDPETGQPYDPVLAASPQTDTFATTTVNCNVVFKAVNRAGIRGESQATAIGWMETGDVMLIADIADRALIDAGPPKQMLAHGSGVAPDLPELVGGASFPDAMARVDAQGWPGPIIASLLVDAADPGGFIPDGAELVPGGIYNWSLDSHGDSVDGLLTFYLGSATPVPSGSIDYLRPTLEGSYGSADYFPECAGRELCVYDPYGPGYGTPSQQRADFVKVVMEAAGADYVPPPTVERAAGAQRFEVRGDEFDIHATVVDGIGGVQRYLVFGRAR